MKHWLLVLVAGCGRYDFNPLVDSLPATTARLHRQDDVFDDGARHMIGAYDTLLQVPCSPTATTTGFACLPTAVGLPYYTDAACSQAVMQTPTCGITPAYAYDPINLPVAHVYAVGADIATPAMQYLVGADGSCQLSGTPAGAYKALTEIPFDTFVPLTRELGAGTRVRAQAFVASDGFSLPGDLFDTQAMGSCIAEPYDDATLCDPYSLGVALDYTDSTCSHLVYHSNAVVDFALEFLSPTICRSTDDNVRPSLGPIQPSKIWVEIPGSGTCAQSAPAPGWIIEDLGAPITRAPVTQTNVSAGGTRIQLIQDASGAATSAEYDVFDSRLGFECYPESAADGVVRCLPRKLSFLTNAFSDAGCTQPLALAPYGPNPCTTPLPPLLVGNYTSSGCMSQLHIYQPGPKYTGPIYSGSPGSCSTVTASQDEYRVGSEIDPTTFAAVTEQIEP
jgi:hypothetical protein